MIITQTPLRISLVGGGTDFAGFYTREEGCVISVGIDKFVYVIVKERYDERIYVNYSRKEIVDSISELEHELVREAMRKTGVHRGVEITSLADIPSEGSGLGSSSSLTVGLLNALYVYQGNPRPPEQLAREACDIEVEVLGKPVGKQDQYIAAYGGLRRLVFERNGSVRVEPIAVADSLRRRLNDHLMMFYTNRTRRSEDILSEQKAGIRDSFCILQRMKSQTTETYEAIVAGHLGKIGDILDEGWRLKKSLATRISDNQIDRMYSLAISAGAQGGKICGAGGGGFLLVYCTPERQDAVRDVMKEYREMPFSLERDGSKVIFNVRREGWPRN